MSEPKSPAVSNQRRGWMVPAAVVFVVLLAAWGIFSRLQARADLRKSTEAQAAPTVAVVSVGTSAAIEELVLPGDVQALADAPIYARTSGYLKRWLVDIGSKVQAGQLLAEIDAPEIDQQLIQAQAELRTALANENLSSSTAARWEGLLETQSVSQQETDEKRGDLAAKRTLSASARANVQRLRELEGFSRVVAPFAGTITARRTDVGALIGNASGTELFHIADLSRLRVYVQVPQPYAPQTRTGLQADLHFAERPNQTYPAKIVRTADALDPNARTLLAELEVDNADGTLFPGSYAEVHFKIPAQAGIVRVPANTLIFRSEGLLVGSVDPDHRVVLKPVVQGRDFGTEVEVVSGVTAGDTLIINPPDSLAAGTQVRVAATPPTAGGNGQPDAAKHP